MPTKCQTQPRAATRPAAAPKVNTRPVSAATADALEPAASSADAELATALMEWDAASAVSEEVSTSIKERARKAFESFIEETTDSDARLFSEVFGRYSEDRDSLCVETVLPGTFLSVMKQRRFVAVEDDEMGELSVASFAKEIGKLSDHDRTYVMAAVKATANHVGSDSPAEDLIRSLLYIYRNSDFDPEGVAMQVEEFNSNYKRMTSNSATFVRNHPALFKALCAEVGAAAVTA